MNDAPIAAPDCADLFEDLFVWAADLATDEDCERGFRPIGQLVFDLRAECESGRS